MAARIRANVVTEMTNYAHELLRLCEEKPIEPKKLKQWANNILLKLKRYEVISNEARSQQYHIDSDFLDKSSVMTVQDICEGLKAFRYGN